MRRMLLWLLIASGFPLAGCNGLQKKHDNPVMAAAPRRVAPEEPADDEDSPIQNVSAKQTKEDEGSEITPVAVSAKKNPWDGWKDDTTIFNSQVAATVNGAPILNGDILDRHADDLIRMREKMQKAADDPNMRAQYPVGPADYERFRIMMIQQQIVVYIQKKLLVERLKSGMKAEQLKAMEGHIDEQFDRETEKLKMDLKVANRTELELELNKKGTTLKNVKDNFALDRLAGEAVMIKSEKPKPIERPDMLAYYQSHPDKFLVTAKVKWQQIQISVAPNVNEKVARAKLEQAIAELKKGTPFETVAAKYSDGPTAKDGGQWDWMEKGNLQDTELEQKLFSMPLNELSPIHECKDPKRNEHSFCVVKVTARQNDGRQPFKDVQKEIRTLLENEQTMNGRSKLFKELFKSAVIETQYTLPSFNQDE